MNETRRLSPGRAAFYVFLILFGLAMVLPLLWVLKMSIVSQRELYASPPTILPQSFTLDNYVQIWDTSQGNHFGQALVNSCIIAGLTTAICLAIGSLCAYALARLEFGLRGAVQNLVLALMFFPGAAIISSLFLEWRTIGIINTYWGMIIPDTLFSLPLTVWLLVTYFRELPKDLEESARVDGAGILATFWRIILPLSVPGFAAALILTFIWAWNEFLFANTFSFTPDTQPATVVIPQFASVHTVFFGQQAAAAIVDTIPLVALVFIFQRRIVSGLTAGAVK
jgi:multiple sugar transport system permease protein